VKTLCRSVGSLDWRQTYTVAEVGAQFLDNYGWAEILGPGTRAAAAAAAGTPQISCGVLVLGPDTLYPPHCHEAEEIYLPLSGTAEWRQGSAGAVWRQRSPGTLIHHSSEELHAMRTGDHPLLAMYLWRSVDLHQEARLVWCRLWCRLIRSGRMREPQADTADGCPGSPQSRARSGAHRRPARYRRSNL
jgi:hypothetical protein